MEPLQGLSARECREAVRLAATTFQADHGQADLFEGYLREAAHEVRSRRRPWNSVPILVGIGLLCVAALGAVLGSRTTPLIVWKAPPLVLAPNPELAGTPLFESEEWARIGPGKLILRTQISDYWLLPGDYVCGGPNATPVGGEPEPRWSVTPRGTLPL